LTDNVILFELFQGHNGMKSIDLSWIYLYYPYIIF